MATSESKLRVTLIDDVSRKARGIVGALGQLRRESVSPFGGLTAKIVAFGAGYLSVNAAMEQGFRPAANMQAAMTEIGIKADLSQTQLAQLQARLTRLSPQVNQTTEALTAGVDAMLTMGLAANDAEAAIPAVGKAATATGAAIEDLSSASVSAIQNLKVAPTMVAQMLDGMATAGNAGAFELRDMAQYFPQLTASAQTLGMEGVPAINDIAAALQIARRGAGDASTAANNLSDFMGKIMTPQTIKNFKKFGVDVTKELQKAHKKGVSPIEHFIQLIDKKTKGGQGELLTQIFGDKQPLDFIRPMIAGFDDYLRIRDEADRANGTVSQAFNRRMQDANQKIKAAQIAISNLGTSIGADFLEPIGRGAQHLSEILNTLDERVTLFDRIKVGAQGFLSGLGIGGDEFSSVASEVEKFFFGVKDASKAADDYGRIFARFREWGASVRGFYDQVKDNPIVKFFAQMSGYGLQLVLWSAGFSLLAGTILKLGRAIAFLTGIATAVGIIKTLGRVAGIASLGAGTPAAGAGAGGAAATGAGALLARFLPRLGVAGAAAGGLWSLFDQGEGMANAQRFRIGVDDVIRRLLGTDGSAGGVSNPGVVSALALDDARRGRALGYGNSTDTLPGKLTDDIVRIDAESIAAMSRPSGVQDVRVTNTPPPPNVTVHAPITITGVVDPKAAADAASSELGKRTREAVEGFYGGGGGY